MMAERKRRYTGCLSFLRRQRRASTETTTGPEASSAMMQKSKSTDSLASISSIDASRSSLDSFAKLCVRRRNSNRAERGRSTKLVMEPYFGPFAGQSLIFDMRRTETTGVVNVKVKVDDEILARTLQHRMGRKETVKDQCIKFAHEVKSKTSNTLPLSLKFLCEQTVLLHNYDLPVNLLPQRYTDSLLGSCTQVVTVTVWPRKDIVTLKLKPRISITELQWILCKRIGLSNPSSLSLYLRDGLEPLSPTSPLPEQCSELECIIPSFTGSADDQEKKLCVSIIGRGIKGIPVIPSMTLYEFDQAVKQAFHLHPDSFLYLPQVLTDSRSSLKMHATLDDSSICLLDEERRNFPTLCGFVSVCEPQTLQSLLLYQMSICELDLLKAGYVIGFEVTGPTVPVSFKTMQTHRMSEENCLDTRNSIFSVIDIKPHAISVNPDWTMPVLLKYITSISGFPCKSMRLGEKCLNQAALISDVFSYRTWFGVNRKTSSLSLTNEIPEAITG